jgi:hypothetical protein
MSIINIELPDEFDSYTPEIQESIMSYIDTLNPIELKAYHIAKSHLGTSFDILRSNGYADWIKMLKEKKAKKEAKSATKIQAMVRGFLYRRLKWNKLYK